MELMSVTLDVSKLSGWLNIYAPCRVTRGAWGVKCGARYGRAWGDGGAKVQATCTMRGGVRPGRREDVSKASWHEGLRCAVEGRVQGGLN